MSVRSILVPTASAIPVTPATPLGDFRALDSLPGDFIAALRQRYLNAAPFPHLVLDNFFPPEMLNAVEAEFDAVPEADWQGYNHALQTKQGSRTNAPLPPATQHYFDSIYSGAFVRFLSKVTGIQNLVTDPSLSGGGMHQIPTGGRFDVHLDFQKHPDTGLDNRLVVITYLNRDWQPEYGGGLELWCQDPVECAAVVVPEFDRTIIMAHSSRSAHGHPMPVAAPDGRPRRSVAAYFYTNGRADGSGGDRVKTVYVKRSGRTLVQRAELLAQQLLPPILVSGLKALRSRLRRG